MDRRKPILITGASGMLGSAFEGPRFVRTSQADFDIRDIAQVRSFLKAELFSAVLHFAAMTNLEQCEVEPQLAHETNAGGSKNLAEACAATQIPIIYVSTSGVFGGLKRDIFHEDDVPMPQTVYAETKWLGEKNICRHHPESFIIRLPWLFGGFEKDKKFVGMVFRQIQSGQKHFQIVEDTLGSLLFNKDMAAENSPIWTLLRSKRYGLYHISQAGNASRYEIAKVIAKFLGQESQIQISPVASSFFKPATPVLRPTCEVLGSRHLTPLRPWQEALNTYVTQWVARGH